MTKRVKEKKRRLKSKIAYLLTIMVSVTGCQGDKMTREDLKKLEESVEVSRRNTEKLIKDYGQTKDEIKEVNKEIKSYFKGEKKLEGELKKVEKDLEGVKKEIDRAYEMYAMVCADREEEAVSKEEYIEERYTSTEYLNINEYVLQQELQVTLIPYGKVEGMTIKWMKGSVVDYERYIK